jgi:hypothetical protein
MSKPGAFKRIPERDKTITPFKVFKSWRFETSSSLDQYGIDRLAAIKPDERLFEGHPVAFGHWTTIKDTGSFLVNTRNDKEASLIWYSINHLYYKRANIPYDTFGYSDINKVERTIFDEASVISVPQQLYGEQIKPGSVRLYLKNSQLNNVSMSLYDDGKGNLIDRALSSSISNELLYLGFNVHTYESIYTETIPTVVSESFTRPVHVDTIIPDLSVSSKNIRLVPKYNLPSSSIQWGNTSYYVGNSYTRIPNNQSLNFKMDDDFAIAFWVHINPTATSDSYIISKRTTGIGQYFNKKTGKLVTGDVNYKTSQYPFEILFRPSTGRLVCRQSNGARVTELMTPKVTNNTRSHVVFQKTGSRLELYVNGTFEGHKNLNLNEGNLQNEADIFIGSYGLNNSGEVVNGLKGAIDELFFFNKGLSAAEAYQLAYTGSLNLMTTNTNAVGNVFYEHGMIVLSDPRPKYGTAQYRMFNDVLYNEKDETYMSSYLDSIKLEFSSTVTIYEHEYVIKIREDEFNFTSNPTIRKNNDPNSELPKPMVSNPYFAPYITTVGLYNKNAELVAIGKLGAPIHKRDDVDLNILVRFDVTT